MSVFTERELARCKQLASLEKRAWSFSDDPNGLRPNRMNLSWNIYGNNPRFRPPAPGPMTFGKAITETGKGLANQAGVLGRALFTGSGEGSAHPSVLGNVISGLTQPLFGGGRYSEGDLWGVHHLSDLAHPMNVLRQGRVWSPLREALPDFRRAWSQTGELGGYLADKPTEIYQGIKHWLVDPRYYGAP